MSDAAVLVEPQTLLKPIDDESPAGQDPEMNPDYINLDAEMAKMSGLDYGMIAEVAQRILTTESKHLRVATWLTLAWTKLHGVAGLRNSLEVIAGLLDEFAPDLYPEKIKMQSMALQNLHSDKRIAMFTKKAENPDSADIDDSKAFLSQIAEAAESLYAEKPPKLDGLQSALEELSPGTTSASTNGQSQPTDDQPVEATIDETDSEASETTLDSDDTAQTEDSSNGEAEADSGTEPSEEIEPEEEPISVPDEVQDLLDPIDEESPAGEDVEKTDDQEVMVEYMTLESEMAKFSGNNYEQCAIQCSDMLRDRTKHLRIAIWQLIAWYRTVKLTGFRDGLTLIYHLLNTFPDSIHPQDESQQANTLQLLNSEARIKLIDKEEVTKQNADLFIEIGQIFQGIVEFAEEHYKEKSPRLTDITSIIHEKSTEAENFEKEEQKRKEKEKREAEARAAARKQQKSAASSPSTSAASSAAASSGGSAQAVSAGGLAIGREREAQIALKKAIEFYFEEDSGGSKNRKVADDPSIYGLSRVYRWAKLNTPPNKDHVTQIDGPNEPKQNYIQKLISNKDYDTLIPEIEVNFLNRDDFLYWLDAQKYVCEALDAKGGDFMDASQEIKVNLARFIQRAPDLSKLMFKDKKTPFASDETRTWIDDEVMSVLGSGKAREKILPPVIGEDYAPINEAYEKACETLPDNFEENIMEMQQGISGDTRPKGRFLRLLNLANYCHVAGQYSIARVRFKELRSKIDEYNIIEWEQALCVAVWQSTYLNNLKMLQTDLSEDQRVQIQNEQSELFDQISKYDSILALNLMNREKEEGE
jgi:type VI secretion system ImpA/VasJ family protein